jgi:hypothetical protein
MGDVSLALKDTLLRRLALQHSLNTLGAPERTVKAHTYPPLTQQVYHAISFISA